jgi:hypothetical protein
MTDQNKAIVQECKIQAESCRYTAAALYKWLAKAKRNNMLWNAVPIIFGALASFSVLQDFSPIFASFLALVAGFLPSVYEKLELQEHTAEILSQAGQCKNLENRFKQAANITALDSNPDALKTEFSALMRQIEDMRSRPLVIPEKHFQAGRKEVKDGRYLPDSETLA